jgi:hypothetical protein
LNARELLHGLLPLEAEGLTLRRVVTIRDVNGQRVHA